MKKLISKKIDKIFYTMVLFVLPLIDCYFGTIKKALYQQAMLSLSSKTIWILFSVTGAILVPCLLKLGFIYLVYFSKKYVSRINLIVVCIVILRFLLLWISAMIPIPILSKWSFSMMGTDFIPDFVIYVLLLIIFVKEYKSLRRKKLG